MGNGPLLLGYSSDDSGFSGYRFRDFDKRAASVLNPSDVSYFRIRLAAAALMETHKELEVS